MGGTFGFNPIQDVVVYNGELIAGGFFDTTNGGPPGCIVRWTGSSWETLGGGLWGGVVWDMTGFDGELIVGGQFSLSGGLNVDNIARWNGSSWSAMGTGPNDEVLALGKHNADLVMGGWFTTAGGSPNGHWARFGPICTASPSVAADQTAGLLPMVVTGYDRVTDVVTISYGPACWVTDHAVHVGPLDQVSSYGYDLTQCGLGTSGQAQLSVGTGSRFWILVGRNESVEGSAGVSSEGNERPAPPVGSACYLPQNVGGTCAGVVKPAP